MPVLFLIAVWMPMFIHPLYTIWGATCFNAIILLKRISVACETADD